jgi:hypothetical protein
MEGIQAMKRAIAVLIAGFLFACSERPMIQNEASYDSAPDASRLIGLSDPEIQLAANKASEGDVEAARSLYGHYLAKGDAREVERWESWLIERNDPDALERRAEKQFLKAKELPDRDIAKLELLKDASDLNDRARRSRVPSTDLVLINGKPIDISNEERKTRDAFTRSIQSEIERVRSIQSG